MQPVQNHRTFTLGVCVLFLLAGGIVDLSIAANPRQEVLLPPQELISAPEYAPVLMPDGAIAHFFTVGDYGKQVVMQIRSDDNGKTWTSPSAVLPLPSQHKWAYRSPHAIVDRDAQLHLFLPDLKPRGQATWHSKRVLKHETWSSLQQLSPCGPQTPPIQLKSGRIVVPVGYLIAGRAWDSSAGRRENTTFYSDDGGRTWQRSPARLTVPCLTDYPGSHTGGFEPVIVELNDGRVWMVIRTQTGWLYESFSPDGVQWSPPQRTEFRSSDSPVSLVRLPGGEIVMFWHNCDAPVPINGAWIYTGRDALHAAISRDDGKSWRGYREVYLDPYRNGPPPPKGDRGTSYPNAAVTQDGRIILATGQGENRRKLFIIDPAWLLQTHREDDFSRGLQTWCVFKSFGPVKYFKRNRSAGARLIPHPEKLTVQMSTLRGTHFLGADRILQLPGGRILLPALTKCGGRMLGGVRGQRRSSPPA